MRPTRFLAREFAFDDEAEERQQQEMQEASAEEKELWVGRFAHARPWGSTSTDLGLPR